MSVCIHSHFPSCSRFEVERHPEAVLLAVVRNTRVFQSPEVDPVPSESPAAERKSRHAQGRIEAPDYRTGGIGRKEGENEAMVVEAKVAIESHEMGRGVDGLDFASSQILRSGRAGQLSFRSGRPEPKGRTVTTEMYVPSSRIRGLREH